MDANRTILSPPNSGANAPGFGTRVQRLLARIGRPAIYAVSILIALITVGAIYWFATNQSSTNYVTSKVTRGSIARSVTATGSINPVLTITVGSYVSGVIQEINCDFNTKVAKGQLCARIDPRPYQMSVDADRANVATARAQLLKDQANLSYAQTNLQRYERLIKDHAASQDSYDIAANAYNQARAQVALDRAAIDQRSAELNAALVNLGYTNIVAPVDGIVVSRNVTIGQTVAASFQTPTLFLIATNLSKLQVDTNVSESDIGDIRVGDRAQFRVEAFPDRTFEGIVSQVRQAPQTVQNVVTYDVVILVDNGQSLLKPGMTATVKIVTQKRDHVLRVPNQALRYVPGGLSSSAPQSSAAGTQLWLLRNGTPAKVQIEAGFDDDNFTEITAGDIHEGDLVIVSEQTSASAPGRTSMPSMRFP